MVSESFDEHVVNGWRQGCALSPLLFFLYINVLVDRLREAEIGLNVEVSEYQFCCMLMTWSYWQMLRRALDEPWSFTEPMLDSP